MSMNRERLWFGIITVIVAIVIGVILMGSNKAKSVRYEIKPYTGVGSTVLLSGTLIEVNEAGVYDGPDSIVGTIEAPGTWQIKVIEQ